MIWDEIAQRLQTAFEAVRAEKAYSWTKLAKEMNTSKQTVNNWISGTHFPSRANWEHIKRATNISVEEFILGEGRAAKVHLLREQLCTEPAEIELLRAFRNCNPEGQEHISKQARFALQEYPQAPNVRQFPPNRKP